MTLAVSITEEPSALDNLREAWDNPGLVSPRVRGDDISVEELWDQIDAYSDFISAVRDLVEEGGEGLDADRFDRLAETYRAYEVLDETLKTAGMKLGNAVQALLESKTS